jgi:WhiB family redox-sensing transcriptional regulator
MADALCKEHPNVEWFGAQSTTTARAICGRCAVRRECYEYALADASLVGVWGGTSTVERQERRARAAPSTN